MRPVRLEGPRRPARGVPVLATCEDCPPFRELRASRAAALLASAEHLDRVHGDHRAAANLRAQARDTPGGGQ